MEVGDELKLCGVKRANLGKALGKLHSQASDFVSFTLQWKDLEDYLKSVEEKVEDRFRELQKKSFEIDERVKVVEAREGMVGELEVKADGFRREIEEKEEELSGVRMLVEEFTVKQRLKASELEEMVESLRKTQGEVSAELEYLGRAKTLRRKLDEEIERKTRDLTLVEDKVVESGKMLETRSLELTKTQGELDLKVEQLGQVKIEFERHQSELNAEMGRAETRRRELDEEIERKTRDLTLVEDKVAECSKMLATRSLELAKTQGELDLKVLQLGQVKIDFERRHGELTAEMENLERIQTRNRELDEDIERKRKDLEAVLDKIAERGKQLEVVEEKLDSQQKDLQGLKLDLDLREQMVKSLNNEMEETCQKMESKSKELEAIERLIDERSGHCESIKLLIDENTEELALREKRHEEMTEATRKLSVEIASKENTLTERNKQVEEVEKKIQDLNNSSEELISQVKVRQEQVSSINEALRECTCKLKAKRKHRDQVQNSITDLTAKLKSKECHLNSVVKKIQESLDELQSTEEQHVTLKASLMAHEQELELREKELVAREERINEEDQKLQLAKQELAKSVEDYEVKAKQLSSSCQQSNPDQHVALTPPLDIHKPNSRKRGRYDDESLSQSRDEGLDGATKTLDRVLTRCTTGKENTYNFENQRSPDNFQIDQVWAIYSDSDKGMPRKYAQIKRIDTSPEFKLHVAPLVLYRPPPNPMTHPVCCGRFKLKIGKAEVLVPSSFSHKVKAVKSSVNRFEVYPGKGEIWALYKNATDSAETEEVEIVEIVETDDQSIQAMLLTAKVFNKLLYGRCLKLKTGVVNIPRTEVNRFSHQIPAFGRDRRATRSGDCEWWELDSKAVLDLNSKKP